MTVIRLVNGSDISVKFGLDEVTKALSKGNDFIELPGEDGPVLVRPSAVIAIVEDAKRSTAGFRVGIGSARS